MSLSDWEKSGWLKAHQTSREEIQNLLNIVRRDLKDSEVKGLTEDWHFAIAYNAALQICTIALYCMGYKPYRGQSEHYRVIQSLVFTLGPDYEQIRNYLNNCRAKRNISDYDMVGTISSNEAKELVHTTNRLFNDLLKWLEENFRKYI